MVRHERESKGIFKRGFVMSIREFNSEVKQSSDPENQQSLGRTAMGWRTACRGGMGIALLAAGIARAQGLVPMGDVEMAAINARGALFVADKILGDTADASTYNDFTYYRMGLDVELAMNMNIDRMRLGCGGSNDQLFTAGGNGNTCDIGIDYLRFMGRSGNAPGAAVTSDFFLNRPYVELAIKNDGTRGNREVVGVKIGFKSADGLLSMGRTYADGQTNVENGAACSGGPTGRDPDCHSGFDSLSGYLRLETSGKVQIYASLGNSGDACFGNTANTTDPCGTADKVFKSVWGTRMDMALLYDVPLKIYNKTGTLLPDTGQADIQESLRFIHQLVLDKTLTRDFFISFQRERVDYPIYDQTTPYDTDGESGAGGSSRFSKTANTGWWINIPYLAMLDVNAGAVCLGLLSSQAALATISEGVNIAQLPLGQVPASNCYGATTFC